MNPITFENLECSICLEPEKEMVSLDCTAKHEICNGCAMGFFGQLEKGKVQKSQHCPWRCEKLVTSYAKNDSIQNSAKKVKEIYTTQGEVEAKKKTAAASKPETNPGHALTSMIAKMIEEGYTEKEIQFRLNASYMRYKRPFLILL